MKNIFLLTCIWAGICSSLISQEVTAPPTHMDVFVGGEGGYHTYRIPSLLCTQKGTLLALAEGRASHADQASNDIVLKRSQDHGVSWQALQLVAEDGENSLNNPQIVQERESGHLILFYQRYPSDRREGTVDTGYEGDHICRSFVKISKDEGKTWSRARDITREVKAPEIATSLASGPGIGIQISKGPFEGRLLMPFNQGPWGEWRVYSVYSDDKGKSWQMGRLVPENSAGRGNEVQFVELSDGSVMLNSRSQGGHFLRKTAISRDGGVSWTGLVNDPQLIESQCMGSIIRYDEQTLLFANPATKRNRAQGSIRYSIDDGASWSAPKLIYEKSFAYSCLARLGDGNIGLLYERDDYGKISFAKMSLNWLKKED